MRKVKDLPEGWSIFKLGNVCTQPQYGYTTSGSKEGNIKLLRTTDITSGNIEWEKVPYCLENPKDIEKYLLSEGDIVISRAGSVGVSYLLKKVEPSVFASYLIRFKPIQTIVLSKYFYLFLKSPFYWNEITEKSLGIAVANVNASKLKEIEIPIPSIDEQNLIVEKIEELFSELDKGIENLKIAQQQLKVYRQAVLKWAFKGKLTNEYVKDGELPKGWKMVEIGSYVKCIVPNRDKPKTFSGSIPWLTTPDLDENLISVDYSKIKSGLTVDETIEYKAKVVPSESVVMICVGKFGVAIVLTKPAVINQQLHAFLPSEYFVPQYLAYNIKNQKAYCESKSTSTTIAYLNKENCNSIPIPLCSIEQQLKIVQEIESRLSVCDNMEETITNSLQQAEALRQSILKRAFEGKLKYE